MDFKKDHDIPPVRTFWHIELVVFLVVERVLTAWVHQGREILLVASGNLLQMEVRTWNMGEHSDMKTFHPWTQIYVPVLKRWRAQYCAKETFIFDKMSFLRAEWH